MHEMLVCVDLLRRGLFVYRSVSPNSPSDIAALYGKQLIRIEATTGNCGTTGRLYYPTKNLEQFDVLAVVKHNGEITYIPDLETILSKN